MAQVRKDAMKDFLNAIETIPFTADIDEFGTPECVICIERFREGETIKRIPTCRHFFHPACINDWFNQKIQ
jgi:hypothetical protein